MVPVTFSLVMLNKEIDRIHFETRGVGPFGRVTCGVYTLESKDIAMYFHTQPL